MKSLILFFLVCGTASMAQAPIPPKRAHHSIIYVDHLEKVLLTGGSSPLDEEGNSYNFFDDVWTFDGSKWKAEGNTGDARSGISLAVGLKKKEILGLGGYANRQSFGDLRSLNGVKWTSLEGIPETRLAEGGFVYDPDRDRFVNFGGSAGQGAVNSNTWEWDGSSWRKVEGNGPPGRQGMAMVYDTKRKKVVLFGGSVPGSKFGDTWEFDGERWAMVATDGPEPRIAHGYAYDSKRGIFLIFGGVGSSGMLGDTWGWDGRKWTNLATSGPAPRAMGYMTYDKKRDRVVLFGGRLKWPNDVNDTWEWDGTSWKEVVIK